MNSAPIQRLSPTTVELGGRTLIAFAGCDYLGLAHHPDVIRALTDTARRCGISTAASRQTTGNTPFHEQLEADLARFLGLPAAILLIDGYTANLAALQAIAAERATAIIDARAHQSLFDAAHAAGMRTVAYSHADAAPASSALRSHRPGSAVVLTDGIFAADGALAPVAGLAAAAQATDAILPLDDCHGLGTLGPDGRGTAAHAGISSDTSGQFIITGTLAKALGCYGGFVAGPEWVCELIRRRSSVYQTTTPTPPALAAAARESLAILSREPDRLARLQHNAQHLSAGLRAAGVSLIDTPAPIFAFTLRPPELMAALHDALLEAGFLAPLLSYPQGPADRYFRLTVTSEHTQEQIDDLLASLVRLLP
jgi:8-amino-7-oxononanoate synthase